MSPIRAAVPFGDWQPWILFILAGVEATATWTMNLVETTDALREAMEGEIRQSNPRIPAGDLTKLLFTQPYLRIENVVAAGLAQRQTASKWLSDIAGHGFIAKEKVGRNVIFVNHRLLSTLFTTPLPS